MKTVGLILLYVLTISASHASIVQGQQYLLLDHPDGVLVNSPGHGPYGLRLDSLLPDGSGPTFSVELNGASAVLEWIGDTATIVGTIWNNSTNELWSVMQTFTGVTAQGTGFVASAGELTVTDTSMNQFLFNATPSGNVFQADASGHRCASHAGCGPLVARGWVVPKFFDPVGSNDWLVQLTPVPVPAALPLLVSGLLGFSLFSRKYRKQGI
tara:strand:- start:55709 stop:56344 length:636 start_codon:yes stop_codon:yes gene_type:complete